jgi:ferredoxin-type protein NapG
VNRRRFIGVFGTIAAGTASGLATRALGEGAARLRPPGARTSGVFERTCIRCFRCAEVCPPKAIRFDSLFDLRGSDLPALQVRDRACILCMQCTQACPTGALTPIAADPETVFQTVRMGEPVLDRRKCVTWRGEGVCRLCYYACPYPDQAVVLVGPQQGPLFEPTACVGCGLCEEACPRLASAIKIVPPKGGTR